MEKWRRALKDADDWLADLNFGSPRQRVCNLILRMRSATHLERVSLFDREDMGSMLNLNFLLAD
ncbi:MAG: hypothetical protein MUP33_09550 [Polaromonas sp.]|nr:hypothetical protein [Polaromonas sp.]